jgi:hypothetical protein
MPEQIPTKKQIENRIALVKALRSGEYAQIKGCLHDDRGYCCLGVACDIYRKALNDQHCGWTLLGETDRYCFSDNVGSFSGSGLPAGVQYWLGFDDEGSLPNAIGAYRRLTALNDNAGLSFAQIADVIEEQFIKPFLPAPSHKEGEAQ